MLHDYIHLHIFRSEQDRLVRDLEQKRAPETRGRPSGTRKFPPVFARVRHLSARPYGVEQDKPASIEGVTVSS